MNCSQKKIVRSSNKEILMPKIGPNKVSVDPKAYAARITRAKKIVEAMDPATKAKIKEMYPSVKKEAIVNKALDPKRGKKAAAKPMAKPATKAPAKTTTKAPAKTPMPKTTKKPEKMTPQDAAMKKILEKRYGKIYG
jgi:hypothetical protein